MNILTDEEIDSVENSFDHGWHHIDFARAIESAVMSKLVEQAGEEAFGYFHCYQGQDICFSTEPQDASIPATYYWQKPAYTEAQLIAAQQRTAEACAKVCEAERSEDGDGQHPAWYAGFDACADAIRNGDWREYL